MKVDLEELAIFLVEAKRKGYASSDAREDEPANSGLKGFNYTRDRWKYSDIYDGTNDFLGMEIVSFDGVNVWGMTYDGGIKHIKKYMRKQFRENTFRFLKEALKNVEESRPFRGPEHLRKRNRVYMSKVEGDIRDFNGTETIYFRGREVYNLSYSGRLLL